MKTLSQRQNRILCGVVETHIETSLPVGSRCIAEKYALSFSPATIRSEMGALEDWGYLTHTHTSSGRIPTDRGYRYYLDHTPFEQVLPPGYFEQVTEELSPRAVELSTDYFLERISLCLSSISQEISLALSPFSRQEAMEGDGRLKWSMQGLTHILEKPEFQDVRKVKTLLQAFEEKVALTRWLLEHTSLQQVAVSIGHEHAHDALEDCAIVTAGYSVGEDRQGVIAILGPKRMPYRQIIPLVSRVASMAGDLLGNKEPEEL